MKQSAVESVLISNIKWVNSSERLPELERFLVFKDNLKIYRTGNFYKKENEIILNINATENYQSFQVKEENFKHYFWLEDLQPKEFSFYRLDFKNMRKEKNVTLKKVEIETGISNAYLSQLENGKIKEPSFRVVKVLNDYYY